METSISCIICIADINIIPALDQTLTDLALPEVFVQRAKQTFLLDKRGFLGLRPVTKLDESRALIYRMYVPAMYEESVMRRIIEATDLGMGGRGSIFSQHIGILRGTPYSFDMEKLNNLCEKTDKLFPEEHALIACTVSRGSGDTLARAILELGIGVPVVFFGTGAGLRDRLGLMRITIPVEKEIIWFIVSRSDADLVEKNIIPRARLDVPGNGFLYRCFVHAPVVNLRIRHGERAHAATMEQVIAALDEVRGSNDWRRFGSRKHEHKSGEKKSVNTRGLFFIGEEEEIELFRKDAIENGARGATFNSVEMRSYRAFTHEKAMESNSRQLCDIITTPETEEKIRASAVKNGLFDEGKTCVLKTFNVEMPTIVHKK
ncbi:MAG: hypothetical protein LBC76_07600 [Treponema sp.]|jgi:hypothetical protein|nr:hypothetical protein [Treponema sp.]